jgi:microcystin degradation protein MlrC
MEIFLSFCTMEGTGRAHPGLMTIIERDKMKFFMAGLDTETNTFSPIPTGRQSFEQLLLAYGDATQRQLNCCSAQLATWKQMADARGWTAVESLCAVAEPGGVTSRAVYEEFRERIVADLKAAGTVDFVILALHGAMVADGYDDVEGDLLSHIRHVVGPDLPIGVELDLHAHLTPLMLDKATVIVTYKEYPHVDIEICAAQLFELVADTVAGKVRPRMAMFDCRMLGIFRTQDQPLRAFVERMKAMEGADGVLSVSFVHGFPWGDVADVGAKMLVIADGDQGKAATVAAALGDELWSQRAALTPVFRSIDEALDRACAAAEGPIVLADVSDNAGGGAPGDSTFILQRILERGIDNVISALYWDPVAVRFCQEAGEGARLKLRIGGKVGAASGQPLDLDVTVRRIASGITQRFGLVPISIGDAAWVSTGNVNLILNTHRTQVFHPEFMVALGLDPSQFKIIVVKSLNHFHAAFAPLAKDIIHVDAPGTLERDFATRSYTKAGRPLWPATDDPFAGTETHH